MREEERRDKNFRKLCKWFDDASEIMEIMMEECAPVKNCLYQKPDCSDIERGITSAIEMLQFIPALAQSPQDYEGADEEQADLYPELARGLMRMAICVGQMRINEKGEY